MADAVETTSLSLDQADPAFTFDNLSSDNQRAISPTDVEIIPEEENTRLVRIACVSPPLRNLALPTMTPSAQDAAEPDGFLSTHIFL